MAFRRAPGSRVKRPWGLRRYPGSADAHVTRRAWHTQGWEVQWVGHLPPGGAQLWETGRVKTGRYSQWSWASSGKGPFSGVILKEAHHSGAAPTLPAVLPPCPPRNTPCSGSAWALGSARAFSPALTRAWFPPILDRGRWTLPGRGEEPGGGSVSRRQNRTEEDVPWVRRSWVPQFKGWCLWLT